jgi:hypothetical protein
MLMPLHGAKEESGRQTRRAGPPFLPGTVVLAHEEPRGERVVPGALGNLRGQRHHAREDAPTRRMNFV